nr:MAG TPA: hypothetical protein [Caudoviricetes sp.]
MGYLRILKKSAQQRRQPSGTQVKNQLNNNISERRKQCY